MTKDFETRGQLVEESDLLLPNGKKIFFRRAKADSEKAVLIMHGACEHSGRYLHVISFLLENGYSVFIPDLPGHGKSEGKRVHIENFEDFLVLVNQMLQIIRKDHQRIHLLGHSMGGLIAARYVEDYQPEIASLILSSPLFGWVNIPVNVIKYSFADIVAKFFPELIIKKPVNPPFLSHDEAVVKKYNEDPLVFNLGTTKTGAELTKSFKLALKGAEKIKTPLLILLGGSDKITSVEASKKFFKEAKNSKIKDLQVFDNFFHEIFNELGKEKPFNTLREWLRKIDE